MRIIRYFTLLSLFTSFLIIQYNYVGHNNTGLFLEIPSSQSKSECKERTSNSSVRYCDLIAVFNHTFDPQRSHTPFNVSLAVSNFLSKHIIDNSTIFVHSNVDLKSLVAGYEDRNKVKFILVENFDNLTSPNDLRFLMYNKFFNEYRDCDVLFSLDADVIVVKSRDDYLNNFYDMENQNVFFASSYVNSFVSFTGYENMYNFHIAHKKIFIAGDVIGSNRKWFRRYLKSFCCFYVNVRRGTRKYDHCLDYPERDSCERYTDHGSNYVTSGERRSVLMDMLIPLHWVNEQVARESINLINYPPIEADLHYNPTAFFNRRG